MSSVIELLPEEVDKNSRVPPSGVGGSPAGPPRRIIFISTMHGSPWGGSEELWSRAAVKLTQAGHHVGASVSHSPTLSPKVVSLKSHGIDLHVRQPPEFTLAQRVWRKLTRTQHALPDHDWVIDQRPDLVVISQGAHADGIEWMRLCRQHGLPYAPLAQCNHDASWLTDDVVLEMAELAPAARRLFFVSAHNRDLFAKQFDVSLANASLVQNPSTVAETSLAWPSTAEGWKLACVARLQAVAKGQDILFEVLRSAAWRARPVEVNLYGAGPNEQTLRRLAARFELANVRFRGHESDVGRIWAENHLLLLPSRYEGMPLALIEAMWCGRPAVVTRVGGNAEACLDGETGFLAEAATPLHFGAALERAWAARDKWPTLGDAARARAEQVFSRDPVGDFCREILECVAVLR